MKEKRKPNLLKGYFLTLLINPCRQQRIRKLASSIIDLHRGQLTVGQRAMIAEKMATMTVGKKPRADTAQSRAISDVSIHEAAKAVGVSARSLNEARQVRKNATPEVIDKAVAAGAAFQFLDMTPRGAAEYLAENRPPLLHRRTLAVKCPCLLAAAETPCGN
ncbi:hypothetical protein METHP15_120038 [Pseudomonas sp. P15-2025]